MKRHLNAKMAALMVIVGAVILGINILTPYIADDYSNLAHTFYGEPDRVITSFGDIVVSSFQYYTGWGGRFFAELLFTCLMFLPPVVIDVLNTLAYLAVTWLMYGIIRGDSGHSPVLYLAIHVLLWICVPDYGQVMFWICGAANYLYMSIPVLMCILIFRRGYLKASGKDGASGKDEVSGRNGVSGEDEVSGFRAAARVVPCAVLGFIAGAAMEQISAGMMVILTLYLLLFRLEGIRPGAGPLSVYAGSIPGFCFSFFAPGNSVRAAVDRAYPFIVKLGAIGYYAIIFLWIPVVLFAVGLMCTEAGSRKKVLAEAGIYMAAAFASAGCLIAAPSVPERGYYIACVYAILAAGIACRGLPAGASGTGKKILYAIMLGAEVFVLAQAADTALASWEISVQTAAREEYILAERAAGRLDIEVPIISHKYPLRAGHDALAGLSDITEDPEFWINQCVAKYYRVNSITGVRVQ